MNADRASQLAALGARALVENRFSDAARLYDEARSLDPGSPDLLHNLGLAQLKAGNPQAAIDSFNACEKASVLPCSDLYCNRGLAWFDLGKRKKAESDYQRALELDPNCPEANNNYGVLLFQEERFAEARRYFEKACACDDSYTDAWFNLRDTLLELGLKTEASRCESHLAPEDRIR